MPPGPSKLERLIQRWLARRNLANLNLPPRPSLLPADAVAPLRDGDAYRVLSVIQPWAWAIVHAGKDVENRPRNMRYEGPLLIHASGKKASPAVVQELKERIRELYGDALIVPDEFPIGELIGLVDMHGSVEKADSPWADRGACHLLLENPRAVAPGIKLKGQLGIWNWTVGTESTGWTPKEKPAEPAKPPSERKRQRKREPASPLLNWRWKTGYLHPRYPIRRVNSETESEG